MRNVLTLRKQCGFGDLPMTISFLLLLPSAWEQTTIIIRSLLYLPPLKLFLFDMKTERLTSNAKKEQIYQRYQYDTIEIRLE